MTDDLLHDGGEPPAQRPKESDWTWSDLPAPDAEPSLFAAVPLMPSHIEWRN
jgi:hypothetical protein